MRDTDFNPNELQRALLGYDPAPLETALIDWTRENWAMAARGMVYAKSEAANTVKGVPGVRDHESRLVLEVAARVAIAERELMCRAIANVLPAWLEETYGLRPDGSPDSPKSPGGS
jgi:hypothetical protein